MTDHSMDTPNVDTHPLEDYWTPERLAQRDRLAALLRESVPTDGGDIVHSSVEFIATRLMAACSCYPGIQGHYAGCPAARLIAADVRVGPDEGLRADLLRQAMANLRWTGVLDEWDEGTAEDRTALVAEYGRLSS